MEWKHRCLFASCGDRRFFKPRGFNCFMKLLSEEERAFFERVLKSYKHEKNGYISFTFRRKHYKESRILMQLHINRKLEVWEVVHHKDGNKQNNNIKNLKVINLSDHTSQHKGGVRNG